MNIRQGWQKRPLLVAGAGAALILLAAVAAYLMLPEGAGDVAAPTPATGREFFTLDDGTSWFPDDATKVPPFQHEGKTAYRAKVFRCGETGKPFVSHLERYPEEHRQKIAAEMAKLPDKKAAAGTQYIMFSRVMEVKKPGQKNWVKLDGRSAEQYGTIISPVCPEGSTDEPRPVLPD